MIKITNIHQILVNNIAKNPIKLGIAKRNLRRHLATLSVAFEDKFTNHLMPVKTEPKRPALLKDEMNKMASRFFPIINIICLIYSFFTTYDKYCF